MIGYQIVSYSAHDLPQHYRPYIYSKWLRKLRYGNDYFQLIHSPAYYGTYRTYLNNILQTLNCVVRLALLPPEKIDDPEVVLGFSVARGNILDFVYVLNDMRRQGIGRKLVPAGIDTYTHITKDAIAVLAHLAGGEIWKWKFNPFV